jgi:3-phytase
MISLGLASGCGSSGSAPKALPTTTLPGATAPTLPGARSASDPLARTVPARVETAPVLRSGDSSEDVAIWVDRSNPARSTVIGTDSHGIAVYDLFGAILQYLPDGKLHNVDLRSGFMLGGAPVTLVTAGNLTTNTIAIYAVNPVTRGLDNVAVRPIQPTTVTFGSCMYHSIVNGAFYYFVTSGEGTVEQWELFDAGGRVDARKVRDLSVSPGQQLGACVADDQLARLYVGEKKSGIWRYGAEPTSQEPRFRGDAIGSTGHLAPDVEGLAIAYGPGDTGFLVASSEGNNSYAVYERRGANAFVRRFAIQGGTTDGAEDSDGIDVTTADLGPLFPTGLFVAQDRTNDGGNQNFKLVPWGDIVASR